MTTNNTAEKLREVREALDELLIQLDPGQHGERCECDPSVGYQCPLCRFHNLPEVVKAFKARTTLDQLIATHNSAIKTLEILGYTDLGGELWKPPLGKSPIAEQEAAVPVAVVGPVFQLLYHGSETVAAIAKKHGLKVGDLLYTTPQPAPDSKEERAVNAICLAVSHGLCVDVREPGVWHGDGGVYVSWPNNESKFSVWGFDRNESLDGMVDKVIKCIEKGAKKHSDEVGGLPKPAPAAVPEGWKRVPVEPTEEMLEAALRANMQHVIDAVNDPEKAKNIGSEGICKQTYRERYKSMLDAAPTPKAKP